MLVAHPRGISRHRNCFLGKDPHLLRKCWHLNNDLHICATFANGDLEPYLVKEKKTKYVCPSKDVHFLNVAKLGADRKIAQILSVLCHFC